MLKKIRIGITGQSGFIGSHVYHTLRLYPDIYTCIPFEDSYFEAEEKLQAFVKQCDVIIHLAGMNRHPDPKVIYDTNIRLSNQLIAAMEAEKVNPYVLFSSSTQEDNANPYGDSKKESRLRIETWAKQQQAAFTGMIIPNVFGPFGLPNYNSFIATFCYKLTHSETPTVLVDSSVSLIYVGSLVKFIQHKIDAYTKTQTTQIENIRVPHDFTKKVSEILSLLENYKEKYIGYGYIPNILDRNEQHLFLTFHSYINHAEFYPKLLKQFTDERGTFVETIRLNNEGQVSFSTTLPNITRGNHFHTRKFERFTVIKGKAHIQLRKIGSDEILDFYLDGSKPAYVDMPIWYTHNITNVGQEELYTQFWISEWYNPEDGDTFFEKV